MVYDPMAAVKLEKERKRIEKQEEEEKQRSLFTDGNEEDDANNSNMHSIFGVDSSQEVYNNLLSLSTMGREVGRHTQSSFSPRTSRGDQSARARISVREIMNRPVAKPDKDSPNIKENF